MDEKELIRKLDKLINNDLFMFCLLFVIIIGGVLLATVFMNIAGWLFGTVGYVLAFLIVVVIMNVICYYIYR